LSDCARQKPLKLRGHGVCKCCVARMKGIGNVIKQRSLFDNIVIVLLDKIFVSMHPVTSNAGDRPLA
jgi:hypothetical protein